LDSAFAELDLMNTLYWIRQAQGTLPVARLATRKPTIVGLEHVRENAHVQLAARGSEKPAMTNMARKRTVPERFGGTSPTIAI
jgi:hypothetical protein